MSSGVPFPTTVPPNRAAFGADINEPVGGLDEVKSTAGVALGAFQRPPHALSFVALGAWQKFFCTDVDRPSPRASPAKDRARCAGR